MTLDVRDSRRAITFVVNHFHNADEVAAFANHLAQLRLPDGWALRLVVTDNSRSWSNLKMPPWARVLRPPENLGYYGGCEFGRLWDLREHGAPDWTVACNTDLELACDFLERLIEHQDDEGVGVVGPRITMLDGTEQSPILHRRPSRFGLQLRRYAFKTALSYQLLRMTSAWRAARRRRVSDGRHLRGGHTYAVHGSIIAFRRSFFDAGGTLAFDGFMYGEEIHVAEQARRLGLKVLYQPQCRVMHRAHSTVGTLGSRVVRRWIAQSYDVLWSRYFVDG